MATRDELEQDTFDLQETSATIFFYRPASEINDDPDIEWTDTEPLDNVHQVPSAIRGGNDPQLVSGRDFLPQNHPANRASKGSGYGALINYDRSPLIVNCPDATKLSVGYISNGKYHCQWFQGSINGLGFGWDDGANPLVGRAEFDWFNSAHIRQLGSWRSVLLRKLTGKTVRDPASDNFNKYEEDWLREQEAMRHEETF